MYKKTLLSGCLVCSLLLANVSAVATTSKNYQTAFLLSEDAQEIVNSTVYADSEYENIVESSTQDYAIRVDESTVLPVGRVDVQLTDTSAVQEVLTI